VLICMGTRQSICCRDNTNVTLIAPGIGIWTCDDWKFFVHLSAYYIIFNVCNLFFNTCCINVYRLQSVPGLTDGKITDTLCSTFTLSEQSIDTTGFIACTNRLHARKTCIRKLYMGYSYLRQHLCKPSCTQT
jgi:hypothetical protein